MQNRESGRTQALEARISELREKLDRNAPIDTILRELASVQLELSRLGRDVRLLLAGMRFRDSVLPLLNEERKKALSFRADAGLPLGKENGFYQIEYDQFGTPYRWTGPESTFWFQVDLDRTSPMHLVLSLGKGSPREAVAGLRLFADEQEVEPVVGLSDLAYEVEAVLPARSDSGLTTISALVPRMKQPEGEDTRTLGVVFYSIAVMRHSSKPARTERKDADESDVVKPAVEETENLSEIEIDLDAIDTLEQTEVDPVPATEPVQEPKARRAEARRTSRVRN